MRSDENYSILARIVQATEIDTIVHTFLVVDSTQMRVTHDARDQRHRHHEPVRRGVGAGQHGAQRRGEVVGARLRRRRRRTRSGSARTPAAPTPPRTRVERSLVEVEGYVRDFAVDNPHVNVTLLRFSNVLGPDIVTPLTKALELPLVPSIFGFDPRFQFVHEDDVDPVDPVRARPRRARHLQRRRRRPAPVERGRRHLRQAHLPHAAVRHRASPPSRCAARASTCRPSCSTLLRYGRGIDNRAPQGTPASSYQYTSAGAVQAFVEALRLRATVGDHRARLPLPSATSNSSSATPPRSCAIGAGRGAKPTA